jgi:phospholipase C
MFGPHRPHALSACGARWIVWLALVAALALAGCGLMPTAKSNPIEKIGHVIIVYQENWSFDSLYGKFPGANGLDRAQEALPQVDKQGNPYPTLPPPLDTTKKPVAADARLLFC